MATSASEATESSNRLPLQKPIILQKSSKSNFKESDQDVILLAKHSEVPSQAKQQISKQDLVTMDTVRKKEKFTNKDLLRIRTPPPSAVARRNARERNRVKQVNNGFANLRQHIPNAIAATFESGRNGNKKPSKVETLRMAVEYIKSLEDLLSLSEASPVNDPKLNPSSLSYSQPSLKVQTNLSYATSPSSDDDNISCTSTPPPPSSVSLQYVQINSVESASSYHIVPVHIFENDDHLNTLLSGATLIDEDFKAVQLTSDTTTSLSPEVYSDNSLSPATGGIPVFGMEELASSLSVENSNVKDTLKSTDELKVLCRNLIMLQADPEELGKQLTDCENEFVSWS